MDEVLFRYPELFDPRGAKPLPRVRNDGDGDGDGEVTEREAFIGRPKSYYSLSPYLTSLQLHERNKLKVIRGDEDNFVWFSTDELACALNLNRQRYAIRRRRKGP